MAFTDGIQSFETGMVRRMTHALNQARVRYADYRKFRQTFEELNNLSQRDLADLGTSRENIAEIARAAAYGE